MTGQNPIDYSVFVFAGISNEEIAVQVKNFLWKVLVFLKGFLKLSLSVLPLLNIRNK